MFGFCCCRVGKRPPEALARLSLGRPPTAGGSDRPLEPSGGHRLPLHMGPCSPSPRCTPRVTLADKPCLESKAETFVLLRERARDGREESRRFGNSIFLPVPTRFIKTHHPRLILPSVHTNLAPSPRPPSKHTQTRTHLSLLSRRDLASFQPSKKKKLERAVLSTPHRAHASPARPRRGLV